MININPYGGCRFRNWKIVVVLVDIVMIVSIGVAVFVIKGILQPSWITFI